MFQGVPARFIFLIMFVVSIMPCWCHTYIWSSRSRCISSSLAWKLFPIYHPNNALVFKEHCLAAWAKMGGEGSDEKFSGIACSKIPTLVTCQGLLSLHKEEGPIWIYKYQFFTQVTQATVLTHVNQNISDEWCSKVFYPLSIILFLNYL